MLPPNLHDSFHLATEGIVKGLAILGIEAEIQGSQWAGGLSKARQSEIQRIRKSDQRVQSGACFDSPSWYEVVSGNKKLVGSAQARLKGVFLQHGSILIRLDADKVCQVLQYDSSDAMEQSLIHLSEHATSIEELLGHSISFAETEKAITMGMREHLDPIELVEDELLPEELSLVNDLISQKYNADAWTRRR